ncbi:hypothetical protein C7S20_06865 [Christiangramia fulva]|uniref:Lipoprotein n=1 Tax=Christiangramia fulva TaxID=2126553 RepID=A0A2R3Z442_9FLAO|nr:hypothetical protein [Christiangramia fulva]AVR45014.1 hypothetical protein C7S20_06865 [Christiangramia fulva]
MKKIYLLPLILFMGACSTDEQGGEGELKTLDYTVEIQGCENFTSNFGTSGTLEVTNDDTNIYVTVLANSPKTISQIRLGVFTDGGLAGLTGTAINNMAKYDYDPSVALKTYTYPIYHTDGNGNFIENYPDGKINILARATIDGSAIWVTGTQFGTGGGQGYYYVYNIQECQLEDTSTCESAYAYYANYSIPLNDVYTTPKNWGWYEELDFGSATSYTMDVYVGAGQNDITKGTKVGTVTLTLSDSKIVEASFNLISGYSMGSYEIFSADQLPITRPGPGQYTNSGDVDADGKISVILHATICW